MLKCTQNKTTTKKVVHRDVLVTEAPSASKSFQGKTERNVQKEKKETEYSMHSFLSLSLCVYLFFCEFTAQPKAILLQILCVLFLFSLSLSFSLRHCLYTFTF